MKDKIMDAFDWQRVLIENYKKLGLNENELSVILVVDSFIKKGISLVTPDLISLKMNLPFSTIDSYFTNLLKNNFIKISGDSELEITLSPLKERLLDIFYEEAKKEDSRKGNSKEVNDTLVLFENEFGRALSNFEVSTIKEWFEKGYNFDTIKEALNVAVFAKVKTIRYIDKVLLEWNRRDEYSKNGQSALSDKWRKNIDETIEIAKINWMDED